MIDDSIVPLRSYDKKILGMIKGNVSGSHRLMKPREIVSFDRRACVAYIPMFDLKLGQSSSCLAV